MGNSKKRKKSNKKKQRKYSSSSDSSTSSTAHTPSSSSGSLPRSPKKRRSAYSGRTHDQTENSLDLSVVQRSKETAGFREKLQSNYNQLNEMSKELEIGQTEFKTLEINLKSKLDKLLATFMNEFKKEIVSYESIRASLVAEMEAQGEKLIELGKLTNTELSPVNVQEKSKNEAEFKRADNAPELQGSDTMKSGHQYPSLIAQLNDLVANPIPPPPPAGGVTTPPAATKFDLSKPNLKYPHLRKCVDENSDWKLMRQRIENEIKAHGCEPLIDRESKGKKPDNWTLNEYNRANIATINYIENQLHDAILRSFEQQTSPLALLDQVGHAIQYKGDTAHFQYTRQLHNLVYEGETEPQQFLNSFNRIVDNLRAFKTPFTSDQEKQALMMAIENFAPEIITANIAALKANPTGNGLSVLEIRNMIKSAYARKTEANTRSKIQKNEAFIATSRKMKDQKFHRMDRIAPPHRREHNKPKGIKHHEVKEKLKSPSTQTTSRKKPESAQSFRNEKYKRVPKKFIATLNNRRRARQAAMISFLPYPGAADELMYESDQLDDTEKIYIADMERRKPIENLETDGDVPEQSGSSEDSSNEEKDSALIATSDAFN